MGPDDVVVNERVDSDDLEEVNQTKDYLIVPLGFISGPDTSLKNKAEVVILNSLEHEAQFLNPYGSFSEDAGFDQAHGPNQEGGRELEVELPDHESTLHCEPEAVSKIQKASGCSLEPVEASGRESSIPLITAGKIVIMKRMKKSKKGGDLKGGAGSSQEWAIFTKEMISGEDIRALNRDLRNKNKIPIGEKEIQDEATQT